MQIGDFNSGVSGRLREIVDNGQPERVTWQRKPYVTVAPSDLFDELIEAAGERGQEVLQRHRKASEQQKESAA